jgi:hypothetical protein
MPATFLGMRANAGLHVRVGYQIQCVSNCPLNISVNSTSR